MPYIYLIHQDLENVPSGTTFKFRVHPRNAVEQYIEGLIDSNVASKKKAVFNLKTELMVR